MWTGRRTVLLTLSTLALGLAGCMDGGTSADVAVENSATETLTASVRVISRTDEETLVDETFTLEPGLDRK